MKKMLWLMVSGVIVLLLVACGNSVDDTTSDKYITKAEEVVSLLNDAKYADVHAMFDEEMKVGLPEDAMEDFAPIFEQSGDFEKVNKSSVEEKDGHYIVVLAVNYSEENRVFTITFNDQDEVAGLYVK